MASSGDWEQRYADSNSNGLFSATPSELLTANQHAFHTGMRALMLADGEGRNAIWLAERGLQVTVVDISATALQRARQRAAAHGVNLQTIDADVTRWGWPEQHFDVIGSFFLHLPGAERRALHRAMWQHLQPGGLIVIEGFHHDQAQLSSGGPRDPDLLLGEDSLREDFSQAEIVTLARVSTRVEMNQQDRGEGVALHFIARRRPA